jgi:hypothetical protein
MRKAREKTLQVLLKRVRRFCAHERGMDLGIFDFGREQHELCLGCGAVMIRRGPAASANTVHYIGKHRAG